MSILPHVVPDMAALLLLPTIFYFLASSLSEFQIADKCPVGISSTVRFRSSPQPAFRLIHIQQTLHTYILPPIMILTQLYN